MRAWRAWRSEVLLVKVKIWLLSCVPPRAYGYRLKKSESERGLHGRAQDVLELVLGEKSL